MNMGKPGPSPQVKDDEIVEAIIATEGRVASTSDISEKVGLSNARTRDRLESLYKDRVIEYDEIAGSKAWYVANLADRG